jgi:hypothetical protein
MIKRVQMVGLLPGVEGFAPPGGIAQFLSGMFEYQGYDYYVRPTGRFGVWDVIKCANDGGPLAEYRVQRDRKKMTCDCQAGSKHLACRHKEMVEMFESNREEGTCGTQPKAPPPKVTRPIQKRVSVLDPGRKQDLRTLLDGVNALLERTDASR